MEYKEEEEICIICNDVKKHSTNTFVCIHNFCQECIVKWYRECKSKHLPITCPVCRKVDNIWGT
jgi:hypothetical protein